MKKALLTGITGQDGSYLTELLLAKGYEVHGVIRRASTFNTDRIDHLYRDPHESGAKMLLHYGDLADASGLRVLLERVQPDEVYNLGAQSHVKVSYDQAEYTADVTGLGTLRLLEAIRDYQDRTGQQVRFYQASSSEMFGAAKPPQGLHTPFHPRSPYAVAKVYSYWQTVNHREAYDMYSCNGILFNHESPRRGETFVTRKITRAVGRIKMGLQPKLYLGNLDAKRDWGHARDYVEAMWMMLQQDAPRDYCIATGEAYSVREFAQRAFDLVGLDAEEYIEIDPRYFRPAEVDYLLGDATETREVLGWTPKTSFDQLVQEMVEHDLELAQQEKTLIDAGHQIALKGVGNT
ncbi:GDPmannose 4,6-dehydratase [Deinococcus metalli]|uniref:GDP-mannose 4,6-dehydratase n=1 Tax=Deinococcus metalli TaxID=1141878 RepID=A0A7W8NRA9_9DEIO|nr:GDP-mannose 4,6-dehydratase [Deinococcus metalli]MBB5375952.1 GDPmannose 4,6-dehydratase [Deinococcus metalli]GHF35867.1 GDP-mannose 4,6-dehydratase [Deinococcus metalli]